MRNLWARGILVALIVLAPTAAAAVKCTRVLPKEVFAFFNDNARKVDCEDYEYKLFDLNGDGQLEISVTNYRRSCEDIGYCNFELFEKKDKTWLHIGTLPGRVRVMATKTNGYHDLATWLLGSRYVYVWDGNSYRDINQAGDKIGEPTIGTPSPTPPPATPEPTPPATD